ncbi:MAG TPA: DUF4038 domain-containing protein [Thermoanaerobaculia bacterium]|nr:DUF4038 domain-containing protein [Thermoanaerobaculia bacterium]
MRHVLASALALTALGALAPPAAQAQTLPLWSVCEVTRETASRPINAYVTPDATATFTGPGGVTKSVRGFVYELFDPNVATGRWRARYKFRLAVTVAGSWSYTVSSGESGLNLTTPTPVNLSECRTPVTPLRGFLRRDAAKPLSFVWDDGQHAFIWGQTYYQLVNNARCELDNSLGISCTELYNWRASIDNTKTRRMSKVRLLIAPWIALGRGSGTGSDYTGASGPYLRTSGGTGPFDRSQLDHNHWKALDTVIRYLYDKGMIAELILFRDFTGTNDAQVGTLDEDKRFVGYAVARYAAFPNVVWSLANEWQNAHATPNPSHWNALGACVRSGCSDTAGRTYLGDPWLTQGANVRPLTIHPNHKLQADGVTRNGQCFSFFAQTWPSSVSLQWSGSSAYPNGDQLGYNGAMCNKPGGTCQGGANKSWPVTNDEYGYFETNQATRHRNKIWGLATGGGYGTSGDTRTAPAPIFTGAWAAASEYSDIQRVIDYFAPVSTPASGRALLYWDMTGAESCGVTDRIHVLTDSLKTQMVVYFAVPGSNLNVSVVPNTSFYHRWWYNPRTPTSQGQDETDGGCASGNTFTTPDQLGDWVLRLKKCPFASCTSC